MFLFRFRFEYEILQEENQRKFQNQTFKRKIIRHFENRIFWIIHNEPLEIQLADCKITL